MIKLILFHFILSTGFGSWSAEAQGQSDHFVLPPGKAIYQPKEFAGQDRYSDTSRYSYRRMSCTDNLAIFWEKGFGNDLAAPPDLEGHPMAVDLENLKYQLERFYLFYRDSLKFVKPGSQSEKYRMMAMVQYSLEGTAYGGDYDQVLGAFWATPNRLQDKRLITRLWANSFPDFRTCLEEKEDGWYQVRKAWCPENYGFNAIHLKVPAAGTTVQITFAGITPAEQDYNIQSPEKAGWRYGFVGVTATGQTIRGEVHKNRKGKVSFKTPKDQPLSHLWLVVMGAPAEHRMNPGWNPQGPQPTDAQWPYKIKVKGTEIL